MSRTLVPHARRAIDVVESAYALEGTDSAWLEQVLAAAAPDLELGDGVYAFTARISPRGIEVASLAQDGIDPRFAAAIARLNREAPREFMDEFVHKAVLCGGVIALCGPDHPSTLQIQAAGAPMGICDAFSLIAQDGEGWGVTMTALASSPVAAPPRVAEVWRRVGIHLASASRLRRRLAATHAQPDALLATSGTLAHAEPELREDRSGRSALTAAVKAMERARSRELRASPDRALELWQGLVAGRWSLVDHWERDGKRYLAAFQNRPEVRDPRALSPQERAIVKLASLGAGNKDIAFGLGLPLASVEGAVRRILRKLRCKRRSDLAALGDLSKWETWRLELGDEALEVMSVDLGAGTSRLEGLTSAEREVAAQLVRGVTNLEIARVRGTSANTVANQVRAIYDKLGVSSRAELVHRMTQGRS